jgi:lysophospholipase L1-like esterase
MSRVWRTGRTRRFVAASAGVAAVLGVVLVGFGSAAASTGLERRVVGFGDSVPAGQHCACPSFVQQYADRVGTRSGTKSVVENLAVDGSNSADLLRLIGTTQGRQAVERATTVVIMTGANDYQAAFKAVAAGGSPAQYQQVAARVQSDLTMAVGRIHLLNRRAHVVIADYWAAMEDGQMAQRDYTPAQLTAARQATDSLNAALLAASQATHTAWVSTWQAFHAQSDVTDLLLPDGDHPNSIGTAVIAEALDAVLPLG